VTAPDRRTFEDSAHGEVYERVPAAEFPDGDAIDSTTVEDDGGPE